MERMTTCLTISVMACCVATMLACVLGIGQAYAWPPAGADLVVGLVAALLAHLVSAAALQQQRLADLVETMGDVFSLGLDILLLQRRRLGLDAQS